MAVLVTRKRQRDDGGKRSSQSAPRIYELLMPEEQKRISRRFSRLISERVGKQNILLQGQPYGRERPFMRTSALY